MEIKCDNISMTGVCVRKADQQPFYFAIMLGSDPEGKDSTAVIVSKITMTATERLPHEIAKEAFIFYPAVLPPDEERTVNNAVLSSELPVSDIPIEPSEDFKYTPEIEQSRHKRTTDKLTSMLKGTLIKVQRTKTEYDYMFIERFSTDYKVKGHAAISVSGDTIITDSRGDNGMLVSIVRGHTLRFLQSTDYVSYKLAHKQEFKEWDVIEDRSTITSGIDSMYRTVMATVGNMLASAN